MAIERSHWELIAFLLIETLTSKDDPYFNRRELMDPVKLPYVVKLLALLRHKPHQQFPEQTLQRTIQNLRDKGHIQFLGKGQYKLTDTGQLEVKKSRELIKISFADDQ